MGSVTSLARFLADFCAAVMAAWLELCAASRSKVSWCQLTLRSLPMALWLRSRTKAVVSSSSMQPLPSSSMSWKASAMRLMREKER